VHTETKVTKIIRLPNGMYHVHTTDRDGVDTKTEYHGVIIAAPFEFANIEFTDIEWNMPKREWVPLDLHVVTASGLNKKYFPSDPKAKAEPTPDVVITTAAVTNWTSIFPVSNTTNGQLVYQIAALAGADVPLDQMFVKTSHHYTKHWDYVYQKFTPPTEAADLQPWRIAPNLIYLNAIEQLFSGYEAAVMSAKNAGKYFAKFNARPAPQVLCL